MKSEDILFYRTENGLICREFPVKETHKVVRSEAFHKSHLLKLRVAPSETAMTDVLRLSPGTPVFTAPECCLGLTYHGKAADTWAVGVTLYCMILGLYPFLGDTLQDTYDKLKGAKVPETEYTTLPNGLKIYDLKVGNGAEVVKGSRVAVRCITLPNGETSPS